MLFSSDGIKSFLIIRLSSLGDILLTTPAIRCLRNNFPSARIDFLVKERYRELLEDNPHISSVISLPEPANWEVLNEMMSSLRNQYDVVVDLHTSLRSFYLRNKLGAEKVFRYRKHRAARWMLVNFKRDYYPKDFSIPQAYFEALAPLKVSPDGEGLEWQGALQRREKFLSIAGLEEPPELKPIALCPGASYPTKKWPQEYWVRLAEKLMLTKRPLWIFGDKSDREVGQLLGALKPDKVVNFCDRLSIAESGAGLSHCHLAVTHDAGPSHMAAAVGTPVVAIFGSTVPRLGFRPYRIPNRVAEVELSCRPCSHLGYNECPKAHFRCMKDLSVERVVELVKELEGEVGS